MRRMRWMHSKWRRKRPKSLKERFIIQIDPFCSGRRKFKTEEGMKCSKWSE